MKNPVRRENAAVTRRAKSKCTNVISRLYAKKVVAERRKME